MSSHYSTYDITDSTPGARARESTSRGFQDPLWPAESSEPASRSRGYSRFLSRCGYREARGWCAQDPCSPASPVYPTASHPGNAAAFALFTFLLNQEVQQDNQARHLGKEAECKEIIIAENVEVLQPLKLVYLNEV